MNRIMLSEKWRGYVPYVLLACCLLLLPATSYAGKIEPTDTYAWGIDDWNRSQLHPCPALYMSYCSWVDNAMNTFCNTYTNYGFSWAGAQKSASVKKDLAVPTYFAWVLKRPQVQLPDGKLSPYFPGDDKHPADNAVRDRGGAAFVLTYKPQDNDPVNIHFIQAIWTWDCSGRSRGPYLDYNQARGLDCPFYDNGGVHGTFDGNGTYIADRPGRGENEALENLLKIDPWCYWDAQTIIAVDNVTAGFHNLTLYGGYWWGFEYSTWDVPEPATMLLVSTGAVGLLSYIRRRRVK